jgi:hypothetical protein
MLKTSTKRGTAGLLGFLFVAVLGTLGASAQTTPNYTQAAADLRAARNILAQQWPPAISVHAQNAVRVLDQAIPLVVQAGASVGAQINPNAASGGFANQGPLHRALALILDAHAWLVNSKEPNGDAHSYRQQSLVPIAQAGTYAKRAITASRRENS